VDPAIASITQSFAGTSQNLVGIVGATLARVFGSLGALLGLAVLPILSFYLLAESTQVRQSVLRFIPPAHHSRMHSAAVAVDSALRSYVRGQALVCLIMGVAVGAALFLLRFPFVLLLGTVVGLAEVVPYLGFLSAAIAIVLAGFSMGPLQALLGLVAYSVINNLVGVFVTPRVMGRYLQMHPFVVMISVFAGGKLLGPGGVLIALPVAAMIQSIISELAPAPDAIVIEK
jgi:predicted PurR-regulated permease PerM